MCGRFAARCIATLCFDDSSVEGFLMSREVAEALTPKVPRGSETRGRHQGECGYDVYIAYISTQMMTTLSVRIDTSTKKQLEALARRARRSKSFRADLPFLGVNDLGLQSSGRLKL